MENENINNEEILDAEEKSKSEKKKKKDAKAELEAQIEALKAEIKEKDDKYLRLAAEYDNFRRRSREEHTACYENAFADTVSELLPIMLLSVELRALLLLNRIRITLLYLKNRSSLV